MTALEHIHAALAHVRTAAAKRGATLDEAMRAMCAGFTELRLAEKELARPALPMRAGDVCDPLEDEG